MIVNNLLTTERRVELIEFTRDLIRIPSLSGQEEDVIRLADRKMVALGY